jgi:hypothetical protein
MNGKRVWYAMAVAVVFLAGLILLAVGCGESDDVGQVTSSSGTTEAAEVTETTAVASGKVVVKGLVDNPMTLTIDVLEVMNVVEVSVDHPKLGPTEYRGVRFSEVFAALAVLDSATSVTMAASDGYMVEIPLSELRASEEAILAVGEDGTISVVIPGMETKNWVKDVISMEFK